jgi:pyruvate carboxylase
MWEHRWPDAIVTVAVEAGQIVRVGATLLSLEAMKMETHTAAERDSMAKRPGRD